MEGFVRGDDGELIMARYEGWEVEKLGSPGREKDDDRPTLCAVRALMATTMMHAMGVCIDSKRSCYLG
jgi:hypothetical protein